MKRVASIIAALAFASLLSGCFGTIDTGNVGVRTTFGTVNPQELEPGFYVALMSSVREFTAKEIEVKLENLTPKAKDNLSLKELDVSIYYTIVPGQIAEMDIKYQGQSARGNDGTWYPMFNLVASIGRGSVYDQVAQVDSLVMHTKRTMIEEGVRRMAQAELDSRDKEKFQVTRVVVRSVTTDPSIEQSIREAVQAQKELERIGIQNEIAKRQADIRITEARGIAESNRIINSTLTREYLQHEQNEMMKTFAKQGTHTIMLQPGTMPLLNLPIAK